MLSSDSGTDDIDERQQTIAIHTFFALVLKWHFKPMIALIVLAVIWVFLTLIVVIGVTTHHGTDYYGNTQYCMPPNLICPTILTSLSRVLDYREVCRGKNWSRVFLDVARCGYQSDMLRLHCIVYQGFVYF